MLVLTRKRTEKIVIGDDVVITVIHTSTGSVKLGIQAPSNVRVLRAELNERTNDSGVTSTNYPPAPKTPANPPMPLSADRFLSQFDSDTLADIEDQVLTCLAK